MFKSFAKQVFAFSLTRTLTRRGVFTDGQAMCSLAPVFHRGKGSEGFNIQPQSTRQYPTPYDFITGCHRGINPSFSIRHTCSACIESSIHKNIVGAHQHTHSHTMGLVRYAAFTLLLLLPTQRSSMHPSKVQVCQRPGEGMGIRRENSLCTPKTAALQQAGEPKS